MKFLSIIVFEYIWIKREVSSSGVTVKKYVGGPKWCCKDSAGFFAVTAACFDCGIAFVIVSSALIKVFWFSFCFGFAIAAGLYYMGFENEAYLFSTKSYELQFLLPNQAIKEIK